jgi:hypothetical protein
VLTQQKVEFLQSIKPMCGRRIVIRAATRCGQLVEEEDGKESVAMGWGSFWTESTRRASLAAIAVSLNTRGPGSDEGKTVSQADACCTDTCKPLDIG